MGAAQVKETGREVQNGIDYVYRPVKAVGFAFDLNDPKREKVRETDFELSIMAKVQEYECGTAHPNRLGGTLSSIYLSDETINAESALS